MSEQNPAVPVEPTPVTPPIEPEGTKPDEPLGEPGKRALDAERVARKAAEDARKTLEAQLKEFQDRDKTDQEKADAALVAARAELAELTVAKTRAEVAAAKGVPAELLSGTTQEEIEAAAAALIAFKGTQPDVKKTYVIPDEGGLPAIGKEPNLAPGLGTLRAAYAQTERK